MYRIYSTFQHDRIEEVEEKEEEQKEKEKKVERKKDLERDSKKDVWETNEENRAVMESNQGQEKEQEEGQKEINEEEGSDKKDVTKRGWGTEEREQNNVIPTVTITAPADQICGRAEPVFSSSTGM